MRYRRFIIKNYRAITGPLEIAVGKGGLMPIIGVNESGKTTILHAIFAFDHYNDDSNEGGRHLKDVSNLYDPSSSNATIEADIDLSVSELKKVFQLCGQQNETLKSTFEDLARRRRLPTRLTIQRSLPGGRYVIPSEYFGDAAVQDIIARTVIQKLPYILYFDDFRDKIPGKIEIPSDEGADTGEWFDIVEQLFKQTDPSYSLYKLADMEERRRKSILSHIKRRLNETLMRAWQNFRLDDRDALRISLEFEQSTSSIPGPQRPPNFPVPPPTTITKSYLKLEVVETDLEDREHFFFISDRSKGFYWFFNFVMKLEFNPKITTDHSIYLLDEPGSYLHAYAQRKLCAKLKQISEKNQVIYCTHSHYLLDPETIPINSVTVADKDAQSNISLTRIVDYRRDSGAPSSALQPLLDALEIKPFVLDLTRSQVTVITEGIYDYYSIELFKDDRQISVLPCTGADSVKKYIPLMIGWQMEFRALWDNDSEGRKHFEKAKELFGETITRRSLRLLPTENQNGQWIMQSLFEGEDMVRIREQLGLDRSTSFERTILALFYSPNRATVVDQISQKTKSRFLTLFQHLALEG